MKQILLALCMLALPCLAAAAGGPSADHKSIEHGKWLVGYGGCNDCHTPGWAEHGGAAPKDALLTGGGMNFQGPWGTTYAPNLRLYAAKLTLAQWISNLRALKTRPAMPSWTFRYLSDKDLADMYAYIHGLGPAGKPAHAYVAPGHAAPMPYFKMILPPPPVQPAGH
jgi:mono/diheme cytochrome c family protein